MTDEQKPYPQKKQNWVKLLKKNVEAFNKAHQDYAEDHPSTALDLTKANLTDADLTNADLRNAKLTDAKLTNAKLTNAKLTKANLTDADLTKANLTDADLTNANLTDANLTNAYLLEANLTNADLTDANLTNADLTDANLTNADLTDANFTNTTFSTDTFSSMRMSRFLPIYPPTFRDVSLPEELLNALIEKQRLYGAQVIPICKPDTWVNGAGATVEATSHTPKERQAPPCR